MSGMPNRLARLSFATTSDDVVDVDIDVDVYIDVDVDFWHASFSSTLCALGVWQQGLE